jgi:hypothetical protein
LAIWFKLAGDLTLRIRPDWNTIHSGRLRPKIKLCLAKTPSGRKTNLALKSGTFFEGIFD